MKVKTKNTFSRMNGRVTAGIVMVAIIVATCLFVIGGHYPKAYSDPFSWVRRAEKIMEGNAVTERAPVFPLLLIPALKVLGPVYVYLANLPFVLVMIPLLYLLSLKCCGKRPDEEGGGYSAEARAVSLVSVCVYIVANRAMMLELTNPYREMVAFSLMLTSLILVLHYLDTKKLMLLPIAGIFFGLAMGTRETCILVLPPLGLLYIYSVFSDRAVRYVKAALLFGAGLVVGTIPLIIQNLMQSGHFWLPSYTATRWQLEGADKPPKEALIPGMDKTYFMDTARATVRYFSRKYGWAGLALAGLGVGWCVRARRMRVVTLVLPALATNFLFYCFYWYFKERYLFIAEIFLAPILAFGIVALWLVFLSGANRLRPGLRQRIGGLIVPAALLAVLLAISLEYTERHGGFKVWHVKGVRGAVLPKLEKPFTVVSTRPHFNQLFSWLLDAPYLNRRPILNRKKVYSDGFEATMRHTAKENLEFYRRNTVYAFRKPFLLKSWFDLEEVFSLSDLEVPPSYYGKPLEGALYSIRPWSVNEIVHSLPLEGKAPAYALLVDVFRVWDYPERTYCRLAVDGVALEERVPNGLHFLELPETVVGKSTVEVRILSDAPLPEKPILEVIPLNGEIEIPFGAGPRYWAYPLISENLRNLKTLKDGAALIFSEGTLTIPKFFGPDRDAYAVLTLEFYQEEPFFRKPNTIQASTRAGSWTAALPGRRLTGWLGFGLGRGEGRLEIVQADLKTSLPSHREQNELNAAMVIKETGFVRLYGVQVLSIPAELLSPEIIDVGTRGDVPWIIDGFYNAAEHAGSTVRWTGPSAEVQLVPPPEGRAVEVRVLSLEVRPAGHRTPPAFSSGGYAVPGEEVEVRYGSGESVEYRFVLPARIFTKKSRASLRIESGPWVPAEVLGTVDFRRLGILVEKIELNVVSGSI